ncbi:MAG: CHAT domain-containing protein [Planctomycetes bacterium]|nr:CHAT domain-containing protein [Planctomycetota bacterium]
MASLPFLVRGVLALPLALAVASFAPQDPGAPPPTARAEFEARLGGDARWSTRWTAPHDGSLRAWTEGRSAELDPALELRAADGASLARDEDSAGDSEAFVQSDVRAGDVLELIVTAREPQAGACRLRIVLTRESNATRTLAARIEALTEPWMADDAPRAPADAHAHVRAAWEELRAAPGVWDSAELAVAAQALAVAASELGDAQMALDVFRWLETWRARYFPEAHAEVQKSRINQGVLLHALDRLPEARAVLERAVALLERSPDRDAPTGLAARAGLGVILYRQGDFQAARLVQERVLEIAQRSFPEGHPTLLQARRNLGATLGYLGEHALALPLELAVLMHWESDPRTDPGLLARMREKVALTHEALRDHAAALAIRHTLVDDLAQRLEPGSRELLEARRKLAETTRYAVGLEEARSQQAELLEIAQSALPAGDDVLAQIQLDLGVTLQLQGEIGHARELVFSAYDALRAARPEDHPQVQTARFYAAEVLEYLGDYVGSLAEYETAAAIAARSGGPASDQHVRALAGVARCARRVGDLERGREIGERLVAILEATRPDDHPHVQLARLELGNVLFEQGDYAAARVLQEKALAMLSRRPGVEDTNLQAARNHLSETLLRLGLIDEARALREALIAQLARTLPPDAPELLLAQAGLGGLLVVAGEVERALEVYAEARAGLARWYDESSADLQTLDFNIATVQSRLGRSAPARATLARLAAAWDRTLPEGHPDHALIRQQILLDVWRAGDTDAAEAAALDLGRSVLRLMSAPASRTARENEERAYVLRAPAAALVATVLGDARVTRVAQLAPLAFEVLEALRAPALVQARSAEVAQGPVFERLRFEEREAARALARRLRSGADLDAIREARARLEVVRRERGRELAGSAQASAADVSPTAPAVATRLSPGTVLVGYARLAAPEAFLDQGADASARFLGYVLDSEARLAFEDLGPAPAIEDLVEDWRTALGVTGPTRGLGESSGATPPDAQAGERLRRAILDPLRPHLEQASRLVLLPDDVLCGVALDALPLGEGVVGDRFEIEVRLSARELLWPARRPSSAQRALLVGGVDYRGGEQAEAAEPPVDLAILRGGPFAAGFSPLPGSRVEIEAIARLLPGEVERLVGRAATVDALESHSPAARWIHVATHGWFAPESVRDERAATTVDARLGALTTTSARDAVGSLNPMLLCGLALAGANAPAVRGASPGLVTAEEISTWDLSACELAVLSACETNVGVVRAGVGVASLQKALHAAGARAVVTSLWKVPDEATAELMTAFYRAMLVEGRSKVEALRAAKAELRGRVDATGRPLHATRDWAGWVLTGD